MIRLSAAVLLVAGIAGCATGDRAGPSSPSSLSSGSVFPYRVETTTLPNGLRAVLVPMPSGGLVSYWSIVRTGSRDEVEEGVTGFAHFFEHMMFRGSEKYPGPVYDRIVGSMGADANAYTTDDYTAYHLSITKADLPTVVDIESDRFQNLAYTQEDFRTEAGAVYGEFRKSKTSPFFTLYEATSNAAFDAHTYKHTTIGFEDDIKRMPEQFAYSRTFFARFYRPENVVIFIAGDFEVALAKELIANAYGDWEPGYEEPEVPVEPEQTAPRRITVPFDGQTLPILSVSFKGERLMPEDRTMVAATLIEDIAFGETSPLYKKLVLDEQRVQFIGADFGLNRDPKLWEILAMVKDPADVHAIEAEIWGAIDELRSAPVDAARLDAVRSNSKYGFLSYLSTPDRVANSVARFIALTGGVSVIDTLFAMLDRVTPADVQRAAQEYLRPERSIVALLHTRGAEIPAAPAVAATATPEASAPAWKPDLIEMPVASDPNVVIHLWFRVGSQNDPPGKEGLAALTAAMLAEGGTKDLSYDEILEQLFPLSASYSASTDKEGCHLSGVVHRDLVDRYYPLFVAALLDPGLRYEDFTRLKSRAIERLSKTLRYSSDEELGKAALYEAVFAGTPYRHLTLGTVAGLEAITLEDVQDFRAKHFTRENLTVAVGGAYDDELVARLSADLARLPSAEPSAVPPPDPAPISGRRIVIVGKPGESTAISFGYPIDVHRGSREYYALWLANSWLGEHRNSMSHLYQVIREARGINYGDYSYIEKFVNGGSNNMPPTGAARRQQIFEVWIRPVPDARAIFTLRAAIREIDALVARGLTQDEFETQREFLRKYVAHFATTNAERLGYAIDDRFYGLERSHLAEFRSAMDSLTLDEVNAAIRKHIRTSDLVIAMVTGDPESLAATLVSGEATPIDYAGIPKPAEILEEDKEIEAYPLGIREDAITIIPVDEVFAD